MNMQTRCTLVHAFCLSAALITSSAAFGQVATPAEDLFILETMAPRTAGSAAEHMTMRYIETRLQELGVTYTSHLNARAITSGESANTIMAQVPGRSKQALALVVPIDHPPRAEVSRYGSAGIIAALHAMELAKRDPLVVTLCVIFVSGEYGPSDLVGLGSAFIAADSMLQNPTAIVYLNVDTVPDLILFRLGGEAVQTPRWLLHAVANALDRNRLPFISRSTANQIARVGLPLGRPMIDSYLIAGHPTIELIGQNINAKSGSDSARINAWSNDFGNFVESLAEQIVTENSSSWERHYLFMRVGPLQLTVDEIGIVATIALTFSVALALAILMPRRLRRYRLLVFRYIWMMPLAALATFAALTIATVLLSSVMVVQDLPTLWRLKPALSLSFKGFTSLLLIVVAAKTLSLLKAHWPVDAKRMGPDHKRKHDRWSDPGILSAAAVTLLPFVIAGTATIDPVASLPFICAYICTLLFCLAPFRLIKTACLAAAITVPAAAAADLVAAGSDELLQALLLSPLIGNAALTFFLLPFIFMALRLTVKSGESLAVWGESRRLTLLILLLSLASAAAGITLYVTS